jgi:hypothetical protein
MPLRLGLGLGAGGGSRASIDSDALSYFSRAGIASGTVDIPQYSAKNLVPFSEQFDNAAWTKNECSVSANTGDTLDPLGTNTAEKVTESATVGVIAHRVSAQSTLVVNGATYTLSAYAKANTRQYLTLGSSGLAITLVTFDLVNGTITSNGTSTARSITSVGNGWYRVSATGAATAAAAFPAVGLSLLSTGANYQGDGTSSAYIWGVQLEQSASVTSYVPTTAIASLGISGTITVNPRQQIIDFIKGVKTLGLWNNMVCWPLRISQNASSGTTAHSLGGFGVYNGTLVNSPTWGYDGLTFLAGSTIRSVTNTALAGFGSSPQSSFGCVLTTADVNGLQGFSLGGASTGVGRRHFNINGPGGGKARGISSNALGIQVVNYPPDQTLPLSQLSIYTFSQLTGTTASLYVNSTPITPLSSAANWDTAGIVGTSTHIIAGSGSNNPTFIIPFVSQFRNVSLAGQEVALATLYKTTLGLGLNLP